MLVSRLLLWFITGKPLLTCTISTEAKEIKSFLDSGKHIVSLQQDTVFEAGGAQP